MKSNQANFIKRLKSGKEDALDYIVDQYLPLVKTVIQQVLRPIGRDELIGECINDVFLSTWQNAKKFRGRDEREFKNWICAIAKYRAIDVYRKEVKRNEIPSEILEHLPTVDMDDENVTEQVDKLLKQLDPFDQKIFIMRYLLGFNADEIAKNLNMSKSAIDNRMYRGRKKLREHGGVLYEGRL